MEQLLGRAEAPAKREPVARDRPLVFLNTDILVGYLRGEVSVAQIFSAEVEGRIHFAVNPIVLQELLLTQDVVTLRKFEQIRGHLEVLPIDITKAEALLPRVRELTSRMAHANDILIVGSAGECDFLVTQEPVYKMLVRTRKPLVVTPEEFMGHLRAA